MSSSESEGDFSGILTKSEQSYDIHSDDNEKSIKDLIDWKLHNLEKPESPDFDYLHKYDSNESNQESEDCDVWSNLHKLDCTDPNRSEVHIEDPNICVAEVQYQNKKPFESDEESEDYEKWEPYNFANQDTEKLCLPV